VGKPEVKRPLGRPRCRRRIILRRIFRKWFGGMDWSDPAKDRDRCLALVKALMKFRVP